MPFADTIAAIREQGGLVYVPHPFDRMHTIPDPATLHRHLADIDVFEVYNARLLFEAQNDEALRFARKYDLTMGAGSDAHVLQGVGTGALRMRAFSDSGGVPDLAAQRRDPAPAEVARLPPEPEVDGPGQGKGPLAEKGPLPRGRRRDDRRDLQAVPRQGDQGDPPPRARGRGRGGRAPRSPSRRAIRWARSSCSSTGRRRRSSQEGVAFHGRAGHALKRSLERLHVDPSEVFGTNCVKFAGADEETCRAWLARELRIVQPQLVVVMGDDALAFVNELAFPLSRAARRLRWASCSASRPTIEALVVPDIDSVARRAAREDALLERLQARRPLVGRAAAVLALVAALVAWYELGAAPGRVVGCGRASLLIALVRDAGDVPARRGSRCRSRPRRGRAARRRCVGLLVLAFVFWQARPADPRRTSASSAPYALLRVPVPPGLRGALVGRARRAADPARRRLLGLARPDERHHRAPRGGLQRRRGRRSSSPAAARRELGLPGHRSSSRSSSPRASASACGRSGRGSAMTALGLGADR